MAQVSLHFPNETPSYRQKTSCAVALDMPVTLDTLLNCIHSTSSWFNCNGEVHYRIFLSKYELAYVKNQVDLDLNFD